MLFNRLFRAANARPAAPPRPTARLSVERLDDRIVPAKLSVSDATILEGNAGTTTAAVVVSLDAPASKPVTVNYATANGTAIAGADYLSTAGTLTFARGETHKTIQIPVTGDRVREPDETFFVNLSGAQGARIADGTGVVTVADNEPRISIGDAEGTPEVGYVGDPLLGNTYTIYPTLIFTVSLATAYDEAVTVNYATADGTALAGVDYVAASGTLTFEPGETTKIIAVQVTGNFLQLDEWFSVNLSGVSGNAQILDGQGIGTIHYAGFPSEQGAYWYWY